jgi:hypothetical protein
MRCQKDALSSVDSCARSLNSCSAESSGEAGELCADAFTYTLSLCECSDANRIPSRTVFSHVSTLATLDH